MVFLEQGPDVLPLFRRQFQIFGEAGKLLIDRLWCMEVLKLLSRGGLPRPVILTCGRPGNSEQEHSSIGKCQWTISHEKQPP